jgi:hypothetical protein
MLRNIAHPQFIDAVAIRKNGSTENDRPELYVQVSSSDKVQYCCLRVHEEGIRGSEDTAPHTDRFNPEASAPVTHWTGRLVGPTAVCV